MGWYTLKKGQQIADILNHAMSKRVPITLRIDGKESAFQSKIIKMDHEVAGGKIGAPPQLIVEKLVPEEGNALIQSGHRVSVEFSLQKRRCNCSVHCNGTSNEYPYFGFILSMPETLEIQDKRREERFLYDVPEMVAVEFKVDKGPAMGKVYELGVVDCSRHGLGILVKEKDFDLLESVDLGDSLRDIIFYATWARIQVDGVVRHKTKITDGKYRGCYILGIESQDIIESCKDKGQ
jgi:hypothetical protein